MGKGCRRRPTEIDADEFEENWNTIFRRSEKNNEVMKHTRRTKYQKENDEDKKA